MLKRLLILAAALAAFFAFVPTSSAQTPTLPTECLNITDPNAVTQECLDALGELAGGGEDGTLPESCERIIGDGGGTDGGGTGAGTQQLPVLDELSAADLLRLVDCLNDLAGGDNDRGGDDTGGGGDNVEEPPREDLPVGNSEGVGLGEDEGSIPVDGVESGYGPTGSDEPGVPLAARGAALLALLGVLATGLVVTRRRRGS